MRDEFPIRADLLEKLKALRPGFVRFPGGTYVQGNERESAFRWKNTIGGLEGWLLLAIFLGVARRSQPGEAST